MDLREKIMAAVDAGESVTKVAQRFMVSRRFVTTLRSRRKAGQGIAPRLENCRGRPRKFIAKHEQFLRDDVVAFPDSTCQQRVQRLKLPIGPRQLAIWLNRLGITFKKKRWSLVNVIGLILFNVAQTGLQNWLT
jgi:transposase